MGGMPNRAKRRCRQRRDHHHQPRQQGHRPKATRAGKGVQGRVHAPSLPVRGALLNAEQRAGDSQGLL
jgi:hypothetical protein